MAMNFSSRQLGRQPTYRSARAVPSATSPRAYNSGISMIRAIQILLAITASIMMITSLIHIYPMFRAVDSTMRAHVENLPRPSEFSDGNGAKQKQQPDSGVEMHHGVHKKLIEHRQNVMDHLKKEREKRMQQQTIEKNKAQSHHNPKKSGKGMGKVLSDLSAQVKKQQKDSAISDNLPGEGKVLSDAKDDKKLLQNKEDKQSMPDLRETESKKDAQPRINTNQKLARGFSGLPMDKTPALIGAKRGTIECDVDVKYVSMFQCSSFAVT